MKIGIISDTHDQHAAVAAALRSFQEEGVDQIIHCGDITSPETVHLFTGMPTHFVLGNCDWDQIALKAAIDEIEGTLYEEAGTLEWNGIKIAWTHGHLDRIKEKLETSGEYDFLFYGHTHFAQKQRVGKTWVVNPGALQRANPKSCAVLDLEDGLLRTILVSG